MVIQKEFPHFLYECMYHNLFHECPIDRNLGYFQNVLIKAILQLKTVAFLIDHSVYVQTCLLCTFLEVIAGSQGRYICNLIDIGNSIFPHSHQLQFINVFTFPSSER